MESNLSYVHALVDEQRDLAKELGNLIAGEVRFDSYTKAMYATDASIYQMEPVGVVIPRSVEDVQATVETCFRYGIAVLPRGGGTSLAGQGVNHAVVIDFSKHLNNVLEVNEEEHWARVQPGIALDTLSNHVASLGLKYGPDPTTSSRATIGGGTGNNSCGPHSLIYGKTIDHVQELSVVLSDGSLAHLGLLEGSALDERMRTGGLEGNIYREVLRLINENRDEIIRRFPDIPRRVSGYNLDSLLRENSIDLAKLVVGSEGTLAVVTEAKVNLVKKPSMTALAVIHFKDMIEAMEATVGLLEMGPSTIELIDRLMVQQARKSVGYARYTHFIEGDPDALLVCEVDGSNESELDDKLDRIERQTKKLGLGYAFLRMKGPAQADVLKVRAGGLGLMMSIRGDTKPLPYVEDTGVPTEKLPEYLRRFLKIIEDHGTWAGVYGHASQGCLHVRPMVNLKEQEGLDRMVSIATAVSDLVLEFGGSLSGEHGDGIVRGVFTEKMFGEQLYGTFRDVKHAFDPKGIMNPGKIIDCPPMTDNLRIGPNYKTWEPTTKFDFQADGGFARAVELCNGVGACRQDLSGTMCPSYMVTRDEEHSTRGRANALRAVLSGTLPASEFASKRLHDALDLCLECKGCKAECPSQVDMAKMKYEFLGNYYSKHRMPLRSRLFGHVASFSRLGSATAPLSNWIMKWGFRKLGIEKLLGIDSRRPLPPFASRTFEQRFKERAKKSIVDKGQIVLFHDTFSQFNHPEVGEAVVDLLEKAGFEPTLPDKRCCGRPMISKGLLDDAIANAEYNVRVLHGYVQRGIKIVGWEPSCVLTLRDEYPDLLRGEMREWAREVASSTYLIEELLVELNEQGELGLEFEETNRTALFHGHCHQKALVGNAPSLAALRLIPGYAVEEINTGCCGMAGSFGYEREHYDISMAVGEQRLFPTIRNQQGSFDVVASGFSCRQQIAQGTGVAAKTVAETLRDSLKVN